MGKLILSKNAIDELINSAKKGYETKWKKEVGGHLLGHQNNHDFHVRRVITYNTPNASRTSWDPDSISFERKGRKLEKDTRLRWIGIFHSHVEISGISSSRQSEEDKETHISSGQPVEIIVSITNYGRNWSKKCLSFKLTFDGYTYYCDIGGFIKDSKGKPKRIKVVEER